MIEKKWLYVIIGGVLVVGIAGYLAQRAMFSSNGINYKQNMNGTQTYSNNEGSVTVGTSMPNNWPGDLPGNYSGAKVVYSGNANPETGSAGTFVSYTVQGTTAQDVATYYQNGLTQKGWHIEGNANVAGQTVITATKDTRTFGISIVDAGSGMITVTESVELK